MAGKHHKISFSIRSTGRQKTLALKVFPTGEVEVRAPKFIRRALVRRFVEKRADWILERQRYFVDLLSRYPAKEFKNGETFPVLGRHFRLKVERQPGMHEPICKPEGRRLTVIMNGQTGDDFQRALRRTIQDWYAALTRKQASAIIRKHAHALAVRPGKLKIVDQAKRWASCSKSGDIRCNWRLAMMPRPVLEYVVVHELCHLKNHDHSLKFWRILKSILPDYEKRQGWLRQHGASLTSFRGR